MASTSSSIFKTSWRNSSELQNRSTHACFSSCWGKSHFQGFIPQTDNGPTISVVFSRYYHEDGFKDHRRCYFNGLLYGRVQNSFFFALESYNCSPLHLQQFPCNIVRSETTKNMTRRQQTFLSSAVIFCHRTTMRPCHISQYLRGFWLLRPHRIIAPRSSKKARKVAFGTKLFGLP